jgi:hypothetical protein
MHNRRIVASVLALAVVTITSGCDSTSSGTATTPPPSTTSGGGLPSDGAPNVAEPLTNASALESDPCSAATSAQIESLGGKVESAAPEDLSTGRQCVWTYTGEYGTISAGLVAANKQGLSSLYASSKDGSLTTFKPQPPINGYPAVVYAQGGEGDGRCTLAVGMRNDLTYTIDALLDTSNPNRSNPCSIATKVAQFAIQHLKGA